MTLFFAGYLAAYLLPTVVGRLVTGFGLTTPQAGAVGSALLLTSAGTGLLLPRLGAGHPLPFAALACWAVPAWLTAGRLRLVRESASARTRTALPRKSAGLVLAGGMMLWSMAQNALWGVSGQIGLSRVGLSEQAMGLVFALALGGGLLAVVAVPLVLVARQRLATRVVIPAQRAAPADLALSPR
ncbi:hypothetical protein ASE03_13090 [Kitasatospora sp. Root187]|nr:hypothetical protein ASC99_10305 [Kitasatospora sp. Root107]KRB76610.1 hypothetical protein ASE03_13090 [Kitasatospora sp. Root187]